MRSRGGRGPDAEGDELVFDEPEPIPSSNRPPDAWSIATASRASIEGWRNASHSTRLPTFNVLVCAASHMLVLIASYIGWSNASGGTR